jgi:hypothetical protein
LSPPPDAADVEEHRAHRHGGEIDRGLGRQLGPTVTADDHPGGAVLIREVVEGPHGVEHDLVVRVGERVDPVVVVQHLRLLAGTDLDDGGSAQLVVADDLVEHAADEGMGGHSVETAGLREDGVDAPREVPLEVGAAGRGRDQDVPQLVGDRLCVAPGNQVVDHDASVVIQNRHELGHRGLARTVRNTHIGADYGSVRRHILPIDLR